MRKIKSPKEFFGKQPGDDRVMIHWNELCAYYRELAAVSDRMLLEEKGKTSEKNDFLILYVSSPKNLERMEEYRRISMALSDPRGKAREEIDELCRKGRVIVFQSYGLHSNEVGGPQMVPLMLYELLTSSEPRILKILEEVIFIISPCSEPDGEIVFTDWYYKYFGTEFEGICSPYLRHNWAGHSNNRDALRECVIESRHINDILVRRFMPQIFQDHHHQCPDENRMSIAPSRDPLCPHLSPLIHRETSLYGAHMALALSAAGRRGVVSGDPFFCDFPVTSFYGNAMLHNIAGMLTENADVRIATPDYIDPETLKLNANREHVLTPCAECPDPWEGGWWHLSDIVEQMYIASVSLLEYASNNRERILRSTVQKARMQTERGHSGEIKGYLISPAQHDPTAAAHLIKLIKNQMVDLFTLKEDLVRDGKFYPAGSVYVPLYQPKYAVVQVMLAEEPYSKWVLREAPDRKERLDDNANLCMSLSMGVVTEKLSFEIEEQMLSPYDGEAEGWCHPMSAKENESYRAVNRLLLEGKRVGRNAKGDFTELHGDAPVARELRQARIGLVKMSFTGNTEEGYTRNLLRDYGYDYRLVMDREIRETGVPDDIDVLIIPGDPPAKMCAGDVIPESCPPEYQTGFGTAGRQHLRDFVSRGNRLIAWEKSCGPINDWFRLGLCDKAEGLSRVEYMTGSSQLNAHICRENDVLTVGMPQKFTLTHTDGPILVPSDFKGNVEILAAIDSELVLKNGIVRGERYLAGTPCVLRARYGEGEILLYTFAPQFRMQQDGTYKLLLNALYK
ncbi:MAG: hypothetical protein E7643_01305 [Ruminococcaceae bacterium]|nr:hypothetical protein [Oscillospiraceae bacterium]